MAGFETKKTSSSVPSACLIMCHPSLRLPSGKYLGLELGLTVRYSGVGVDSALQCGRAYVPSHLIRQDAVAEADSFSLLLGEEPRAIGDLEATFARAMNQMRNAALVVPEIALKIALNGVKIGLKWVCSSAPPPSPHHPGSWQGRGSIGFQGLFCSHIHESGRQSLEQTAVKANQYKAAFKVLEIRGNALTCVDISGTCVLFRVKCGTHGVNQR